MNAVELVDIIKKHKMWLNNVDNGARADLSRADLRGADLREADLRGANLSRANLSRANLRGADLDFSCLPLWCGSFNIIIDKRIAAQIAYHFCHFNCDDENVKEAQQAIKELANTFHRVGECGKID